MILTLPLPPSVNRTRRVDHGFHRLYRAWRDAAGWEANAFRVKYAAHLPIAEDVEVRIWQPRNGDIDNRVKAILDLLEELRFFQNDKQVARLVVEFHAAVGVKLEILPFRENSPCDNAAG